MIRDFATFDGDQPISCDLCIAGAGAAGISVALEFAGRGERVVLLESGGLDFEDATQELYVGKNLGHPYFDLETTRVRFFGGATNHWGGMCAPLDPIDFEQRDWVPYSGWPITAADLEPYYIRAHPLLELGPYTYAAAKIAPPGTEFLAFRPDRIQPKMWRYSTPPTNFGIAYREPLAQAGNIDVLLHANLIEIETGPGGSSVSAFRIQTLDGKAARVEARAYVLALGAIETPRLLLSSDSVVAGGLGNQHDLVGRFFMEHPRIVAGSVMSTKNDWYQAYVELARDGHQVRCGLTASPEVQAREGILNPMLMLGDKAVDRVRSAGYSSLSQIKNALAKGEIPDDLGRHLLNILDDLGGVVRGVYERVDFDRLRHDGGRAGAQSGQSGRAWPGARPVGHAPRQSRLAPERARQAECADPRGAGRTGDRPSRRWPAADGGLARARRRRLERRRRRPLPPDGHDPDGERSGPGRGRCRLPGVRGRQSVCRRQQRVPDRRLRQPDAQPDRAGAAPG